MSIADDTLARHREVAAREAMRADCDIPRHDAVNQPSHYARFRIEPATFNAANGLTFLEGNVIKYTVRAPYKGKRLEDLRKARRCLDMLIETAEREARIDAGESAEDVWKVML